MKKNKKSPDELNYKQAYLYLFQQVSDTIKRLKAIQRKAEDICINETIHDVPEIDPTEMIRSIAAKLEAGLKKQ